MEETSKTPSTRQSRDGEGANSETPDCANCFGGLHELCSGAGCKCGCSLSLQKVARASVVFSKARLTSSEASAIVDMLRYVASEWGNSAESLSRKGISVVELRAGVANALVFAAFFQNAKYVEVGK